MPVLFGEHSYCTSYDERGGFSTVYIGKFTSIGPNAWFDTGAQHHIDFVTSSPLMVWYDTVAHL